MAATVGFRLGPANGTSPSGSTALAERLERLERALRVLAERDPRVAEALQVEFNQEGFMVEKQHQSKQAKPVEFVYDDKAQFKS